MTNVIHRCDECGKVVVGWRSCQRCHMARRALAQAARAESAIRALLYAPSDYVVVLPPERQGA